MKPVLKFHRLLLVVVAVTATLLGVKGQGLVRTAFAEASNGNLSILAEDTAPLPSDITDEGSDSDSGGKSDVLSSMAKRRETMEMREAALDERAKLVAATETRIDGKIATLKSLQDQINVLLGKRDDEEQKQLTSLVKTYSSMKPKDAARIFNTLGDDVLIPVAAAMKADVLAPVLAAMNSDAAQKLTVALANRMKTPALAAPSRPAEDAAVICNPLNEPAASAPAPAQKPK
jgi:flagellar motility protein MotE (MotC chaperone)